MGMISKNRSKHNSFFFKKPLQQVLVSGIWNGIWYLITEYIENFDYQLVCVCGQMPQSTQTRAIGFAARQGQMFSGIISQIPMLNLLFKVMEIWRGHYAILQLLESHAFLFS